MLQDYKLELRMLLKYPGLTLAGGFALAVAIEIGAGWYDFSGKFLAPTFPLPEGDRLVSIETQNTLTNEPERRVVRDLLEWRREMCTIPATHQHLKPRVMRLGEAPEGMDPVVFAMRNLPVLLVLIIACVSVGTLVYARTATREGKSPCARRLGSAARASSVNSSSRRSVSSRPTAP